MDNMFEGATGEMRKELLEWARDMFGDEFSEEELLNRLSDDIKMDIGIEEWNF